MMPGFTEGGGREFAVGSVCGVRWWSLNAVLRDMLYDADALNCPPVPMKPPLCGVVDFWDAGVNTAECRGAAPDHPGPSPDPDCAWGCGYWAYWDLTGAPPGPRDVCGVIEGWGRATIGDNGFRCQYAKITALHVNMPPFRFLNEARRCALEDLLSAFYGVRVYASADAMLGAHPPTLDYAGPAALAQAEARARRLRAAAGAAQAYIRLMTLSVEHVTVAMAYIAAIFKDKPDL